MNPDPRKLAIAKNLAATLGTMTKAGGFDFDWPPSRVLLDVANPYSAVAECIDFVWGIVETSGDGMRRFQPACQLEDEISFLITARTDVRGVEPGVNIEAGERLAADIERLLTRDIERGGLATDTRLGQHTLFTSIGPDRIVVVAVPGTCKVHRTYGEP